MILALSGYANSGKDAVGKLLVREHGFNRVAFADAIKNSATDINPIISLDLGSQEQLGLNRNHMTLKGIIAAVGWERAKAIPAVRQFIQDLGVAMRDNVHRDVWVDAAMTVVDRIVGSVVLTDARFPNEVGAAKDRGGKLVRIVRPGVSAVNAHVSEKAIDHLLEDHLLVNDGMLEDLGSKVRVMLAELGFNG